MSQLDLEEWKIITDFEDYKISNLGRVLNKHGRVLKTYRNINIHDGTVIRLYNGVCRKTKLVKRLVANEFICNVKNKKVIIIDVKKIISVNNLKVI